jgi:type II secretory pathway pseudopilin PulG
MAGTARRSGNGSVAMSTRQVKARTRGSRCAGYTYVALLFLIALMGLVLTLVSEIWRTAQKREKEQELLFIGGQFRQALARYAAAGVEPPHRLEDLVKDPRVPGIRRHLRTIYRDPMTGRAEWGLQKVGESITGVHSLSEEEPLKKSQFSLADQSFEGKKKYSEWVFTAVATVGTVPQGVPRPQPGAK